jgi:transposase
MAMRLTEEVLDWICLFVPDPPPRPFGGRPPMDKRDVIRAIFWILDNGAKWKDLPKEFGAKSSVHRYFKLWAQAGVFERIMRAAGRLVESRGGYSVYECFIDGTFSKAKGGGDGIGKTLAGKGVKIMVLVDANGLPMAVETMSASPHESKLVQPLFEFMLPKAMPERIIGDKAYDSDPLDEELEALGIDMIAPHRSNRLPENVTQDERKLPRMKRRWKVERTIAWIQNFRRLCIRWEKSKTLFQAMLHLGVGIILLKQVYG